ncbi:MAG: ABC transporter substrate-binding protein, partial [Patescibacteria group bacterium]|nr:ABC transporter substrate-binding protein [Patescibacteria group bacterium]
TPKEKILNEVLVGNGQIVDGPILPLSSDYSPAITKYNYDVDKAAKFLENSGWKKGDDELWHQKERTLSITLTTVQQPELERVAQIIQESWQTLGIKTKLVTVPADAIQRDIISTRNYEALVFGVIQNFDSDPYPLWHSSQQKSPGLNLTSFSNARVDELLIKAEETPFPEVRKKKYLEFQTIITDEVPAIFLYSTSYTYLVDKNIKGIHLTKINQPADRFNGIANWYIKTKKVVK